MVLGLAKLSQNAVPALMAASLSPRFGSTAMSALRPNSLGTPRPLILSAYQNWLTRGLAHEPAEYYSGCDRAWWWW